MHVHYTCKVLFLLLKNTYLYILRKSILGWILTVFCFLVSISCDNKVKFKSISYQFKACGLNFLYTWLNHWLLTVFCCLVFTWCDNKVFKKSIYMFRRSFRLFFFFLNNIGYKLLYPHDVTIKLNEKKFNY